MYGCVMSVSESMYGCVMSVSESMYGCVMHGPISRVYRSMV